MLIKVIGCYIHINKGLIGLKHRHVVILRLPVLRDTLISSIFYPETYVLSFYFLKLWIRRYFVWLLAWGIAYSKASTYPGLTRDY
jgi:hypothetical protein